MPVRILDSRDHVLRRKTIPMVKILWKNQDVESATWELESVMRKAYPHLLLPIERLIPFSGFCW
ncbi:hypothetical protein KSP39_PZI009658 [Platanthera zijinensis]|uniref:Chromo domain-containing protein n=1 Tax=Platanthera zijinensis TaxID=2320716 RepID=A0AAP0BKW1_9ASPA